MLLEAVMILTLEVCFMSKVLLRALAFHLECHVLIYKSYMIYLISCNSGTLFYGISYKRINRVLRV